MVSVWWLLIDSSYPATSWHFLLPASLLVLALVLAVATTAKQLGKSFVRSGWVTIVPLLYLSALATMLSDIQPEYWPIWWIISGILICRYGLIVAAAYVASYALYLAISLADATADHTQLLIVLAASICVAFSVVALNKPSSDNDEVVDASNKLSIDERIDPKMLLESITDGIVALDGDGVIRVFNSAAATITGWQTDEAIGLEYSSVIVLIDENDKPINDNRNIFYRCLRGSTELAQSTYQLKSRTGNALTVSVDVAPIRETQQRLSGLIGVFRDITKERQQEQQRAEFISTASHEMRTPVAAIEGYLALAMNDKVAQIDSKARDYLEKAHTSTQHLGKLFQDLLTAAKSEDGRLTCNPAVVEVGKFLDEIIEGIRFTTEKRGLALEDQTKGTQDSSVHPLLFIHADPDRLREVVTNLLDNAIKYTEEGKISIGLRSDEQQVTISVADTGPGISPEDLPHLFQKFYRVDNSTTRQIGGTGLGLFIARKIIELSKGRIWAESELGKGSTFLISLPRLSTEQVESLSRQEKAQQIIMPGQT